MSISKVVEKLTFRLPKAITPIAYNLFLHPNFEQKTFTGNVKIDINVAEKMQFIALHSKFLNVTKTKLMRQLQNGLEGIEIKNTFEYEKFEYFVVEPETSLDAGNYTIDLDFAGNLDHKIVGFYSSTYFDKMKKQKRYF
jgi:puromycin-sensitive aminopeptidase